MVDPYRIRPALPADLPELARIERASFSDPWTASMLAGSMEQEGALALVAVTDSDRVIGSVIASRAADEGEILTISVAPEARSLGLGRRLLEAATTGLVTAGARSVWLEVRESNQVAQAMYHSAGFERAGKRSRFYARPVEDAVVMVLRLAAVDGS